MQTKLALSNLEQKMTSNAPPEYVSKCMGDLAEQYSAPITFIPTGDDRDPPGDHRGTGWFVGIDGVPMLCTCGHVANVQNNGKLGYNCYGSQQGISVGSLFICHPHPIDFAIASIDRTWSRLAQKGKLISLNTIAQRHAPVEGELLYFHGFPGAETKALYGEHHVQGVDIFLHEVEFNSLLTSESPAANPEQHIVMPLNPEYAVLLSGMNGGLSLPDGMSGSALWNTRYQEITSSGQKWSPSDARITGIIWGASTKLGLVIATRIEHFRHLIRVPA